MIRIMLCSRPYLFCGASADAFMSEGCVSFFTSQGFFAALGHCSGDGTNPYGGAEVFSQTTEANNFFQAGKVLWTSQNGVYGAFYDDYRPPVFAQMPVASFSDLKEGVAADLWIPNGAGTPKLYSGEIVALFPDKPHPVLFNVTDVDFPGASFGSSGSVVVQDGKIAAVVAGANTYPASLLYCTSAEQMMMDLKAMIQELAGSEIDS